MVTHDPGDWFEETLRAFAELDYPGVRIVVVDAASPIDLSQSISTILPEAIVQRLAHNAGFGAAANEVLELVGDGDDGLVPVPDYFVFCHDDVAPEPRALQSLIAAAQESGAAVVGPKLVTWDHPGRFAQMGAIVDKSGATMPMVEAGELDQGQHDGLREVFEVPGGFTLVRADLFAHVGGFDEAISFLADDLSLCWRARLAGARVVVASDARVRHVEALRQRIGTAERRRLLARHRLRVVLTSYEKRQLVSLVPQLAASSAAETAVSLLVVRPSRARAAAGAWWWNLRRCRSTWHARRHVTRFRRVDDTEIRRLQVPGLIRPRMMLQRVGSGTRQLSMRDRIDLWRARTTPGSTLFCLLVAACLFMGTRHLVTRGVPAVGDFAPFRPQTLRTLLIVGLLPAGLIGAARLFRPTGLPRAAVGAAVAYFAVPVPYDALADGRWAPLAAYAAAPWLLGCLAKASRIPPFDGSMTPPAEAPPGPGAFGRRLGFVTRPRVADDPSEDTAGRSLGLYVVMTGMITAGLAVFVPAAPALTLLLTVGLVLGGFLAFETRGVVRLLAVGAGGALCGVALHLPRTLEMTSGSARPPSIGLLVAAGAVLLVARGWRLAWALRGVTVGLGGWALAAQGRDAEVLMALAAAGFVLAIGMGVAAVEMDVIGRSRRFGFRRLVVAVGIAGLTASFVPIGLRALDGDWDMPRGDFRSVLAFLDTDTQDSRALWLGRPAALPSSSWRIDDMTAITVTGGLPTVADVWSGSAPGLVRRSAHAVEQATRQQTARLGRLLAPLGVEYIVVPERLGPAAATDRRLPPDPALAAALAGQLDLQRVDLSPAVTVYRNVAFEPANVAGGAVGDLTSSRRLTLALQAGLWLAVLGFLVVQHRRRTAVVGPVLRRRTKPVPRAKVKVSTKVEDPPPTEPEPDDADQPEDTGPSPVQRRTTIRKRTVKVKRPPLPKVEESVTLIRPHRPSELEVELGLHLESDADDDADHDHDHDVPVPQ